MKLLRNKLAVTVIVLSVSFLAIIIYSVKRDSSNPIVSGAGTALNPIQKAAYTLADKAKGGLDFFVNFSEVKKENEELKQKNIELENKLIEYGSLKAKNEELQGMLDFKSKKSSYNYVGVYIVAKPDFGVLNGYIINKGTNAGIAKDMIVMAPEGLVGKVVEANSNWSKVQTLTNLNFAAHAKVDNSDISGIVRGYKNSDNEPLAILDLLPINSKINKGDIITTTGLGGMYPKDLRIGTVVSVEEDKVKVNKSAIIKPFVDFNKLEELYVVIPPDGNKEEIKYKD
ncbi:rod shape-determining protein MreC [Clostridium folliculivorans]|uniref:Cell shape-determining protein MreC n=1 Tax=Clostridium folliculivorans TaxID=2886038 RepID=A0A9W6D969_9CLOT|nr:rod shape-determining protein MreC [Clostridium folliculivorans]GKU23388.1 cell shape-determining protein MreC [Clostridium folliculivorans]GKU29505.1 cell shape-determining protein MreC [Clostridium folliculivorans]